MASMEVITNQNVVARMAHFPLVISTYDMVSNVYCNTKDNHPYLKFVCEAAENGVKTITSAALNSALPFIGKLEPQFSLANTLACKGLDKIEKTLPILHKPSDQIVTNAREAVTGAKEAVTGTMNGAKETVSHTLSGVMDKTRGAVQDGMGKTRTVVSGGVQTVMESKMLKLVSSGVDTALSTSETLVEQYLPGTEEEKECGVKTAIGFDNDLDAPSYYVRLGSLSSKVRDRAYQIAVAKVHNAMQCSQESISPLNHTMDLQIESRTLTIAHNFSQQLQTTCLVLVSSFKGLPQHIQVQALSVSQSAMEIYRSFSKAAVLGDLSDTVLTTSQSQLNRIRDSMDNVMDYLINNTPLNWLVGPFYPRMERATPSSKTSISRSSQPEVEMQSIE